MPSAEAEALFGISFRDASARLRSDLRALAEGRLQLRNTNFDTGRPAEHGEYPLADDTYAELMKRLFKSDFAQVSPALRRHLGAFYGPRPSPSPTSHHERRHWKDVVLALEGMG